MEDMTYKSCERHASNGGSREAFDWARNTIDDGFEAQSVGSLLPRWNGDVADLPPAPARPRTSRG